MTTLKMFINDIFKGLIDLEIMNTVLYKESPFIKEAKTIVNQT